MSCKKGGLVVLHHDEVKGEWERMCKLALPNSRVNDEPLIHQGRSQHSKENQIAAVEPETRGDVAVHGFWTPATETIFDVRITDTNAPSNRRKDPVKILAAHEKEKKKKYLEPCLARRKHFSPLVFSVDGLREENRKALTCPFRFLPA